VTREIINEIMCNLQLNWQQLAENLNMDIDHLNRTSHVDPIKIKSLKEDNLIVENSNGYKVTDLGRFFVRNISAAFDSLNRDGKVYSSNV
jgi:oxygen-independent coproporphyrinogen-3 oxidase